MLPQSLVKSLSELTEPQLREALSHINLSLSLAGQSRGTERMNYTGPQEDLLCAIGKASTLNAPEAGLVARKCGRASVIKAFEAIETLLIDQLGRRNLARSERLQFYHFLAMSASDYRQSRSPVLDYTHARRLRYAIKEHVNLLRRATEIDDDDLQASGTQLRGWISILSTLAERRQTTPDRIMEELHHPRRLIEHMFPGYIQGKALAFVINHILEQGRQI